MKYLKYTLYTALLAMVVIACEVNSSKFPVDTGLLQDAENTGGFLRVLNIEGGAFDLTDISNQTFEVTLEADDAEDGGQLESVDFFVAFTDNVAENVGDQDETVEPFLTVPASAFSQNDNGLPEATITISSEEMIDALGINADSVGVNSQFNLRWALNLDNGQTFSAGNTGGNVRGGSFFNSPFARNIVNVVAVPQDQFVGSYELVQDAPNASGPSGAFGNGCVFDADCSSSIEITVDPNNTLNGRVFDVAYLGYFGFGPGTYNFSLTRDPLTNSNITEWPPRQGTGVGCGGTIFLGESENHGTYETGNDGEFSMVFIEDPTQDCGAGAPEVSFTVIKQ